MIGATVTQTVKMFVISRSVVSNVMIIFVYDGGNLLLESNV